MKLGLITSICEGMTFEEVVDFASENGLECLEVACWLREGAKRRYAGVSHIDVAQPTGKGRRNQGILPQKRSRDILSCLLSQYNGTG